MTSPWFPQLSPQMGVFCSVACMSRQSRSLFGDCGLSFPEPKFCDVNMYRSLPSSFAPQRYASLVVPGVSQVVTASCGAGSEETRGSLPTSSTTALVSVRVSWHLPMQVPEVKSPPLFVPETMQPAP